MLKTIAAIVILTVCVSSADPGMGVNGAVIETLSGTTDCPSSGIIRGNRLLRAGLITAIVGTALVGLGVWRIYETPDEHFPAVGVGLGVLGVTCLSVSFPITTSGVIVKCVAKKRLRKVRREMRTTMENASSAADTF